MSIGFNDEISAISGEKEAKLWSAKSGSWAQLISWAKRASITKRSFSTLSATKESGRASISRLRAKHKISALIAAVVFSQAQRMTGAKLKSTYSR